MRVKFNSLDRALTTQKCSDLSSQSDLDGGSSKDKHLDKACSPERPKEHDPQGQRGKLLAEGSQQGRAAQPCLNVIAEGLQTSQGLIWNRDKK